MKKKKIDWEGVGSIVLAILFIGLFIYGGISYSNKQFFVIGCLEPLANEICEERDKFYSWHNDYMVVCLEDEREGMGQRYLFTINEIENCKK